MRKIHDVLESLGNGTITSSELVRESLAQIGRKDKGISGLHAVLSVADDAVEQAEASDARRSRGEELSSWDGVPVLVKDCIETENMPTTFGARAFVGWHSGHDAAIVKSLRQRGVIVIGKASLDDFAAACFGVSSLGGTIRNPRDISRSVGGSSGGSAAAVAAGYVPLAIGTDTGGSLRIPASLCGVATLRPTIGSISLDGCFPRSPRQDVIGPLASDVEGVVEAYAMMAGDWSLPTRVRAQLRVLKESGLRFGSIETGLAIFGDEPGGLAVQALRRVVRGLRDIGGVEHSVDVPSKELIGAGSSITVDSEAAVDRFLSERPSAPVSTLRELAVRDDIAEEARATFSREIGVSPSSQALARVERARVLLQQWWAHAQRDLDVLLYPAVQTTAVAAGKEQSGVFTRLSEHTGSPAVCVPCWLPGVTLPVSIEVMGRPGDEVGTLAAALIIEQVVAPFPDEQGDK
jgi:mandelamide amidase